MDLDSIINQTIKDNNFVKINNNLYLTNYQIEVLDRYHIDYTSANDIKSLIFLIEDYLEEDYEEELDELTNNLQEFSYYNYTNK